MSQTADQATRQRLTRRGFTLEWITLGWNVIGVVILAISAIAARSIALAGFGRLLRHPRSQSRTHQPLTRHQQQHPPPRMAATPE